MTERPNRTWLRHGTPPWVRTEGECFFLTLCCKPRGLNQLAHPGVGQAVLDSVRAGHERGDWRVGLWLLMPDHLHALLSFPLDSMQTVVPNWKRLTARRHRIAWQRGFFDHRLRNDAAWYEKASYIRTNPVRAGLCAEPEDWPYIWEPPDARRAR